MHPEQSDIGHVLTDDEVLRYLSRNPEFFVNNQDILPRLRIPHEAGNAVSLIERQVSVLRGKCGTLENSLRDLISVARENEGLHLRLHQLIQEIISAKKLDQIITLTRDSLTSNFNADDVNVLLLASEPKPQRASRSKNPTKSVKKKASTKTTDKDSKQAVSGTASPPRRVRRQKPIEGTRIVAHDHESIALFTELFDYGETRCGLPSEQQLSALAGHDHANIASAALIPLHYERHLGVVMLTSKDESRFATGKGVMFLNQLGQLLSRRLHTLGVIALVDSE